MKVKIKLSEGAVMPSYAKEGDAGMDLTAINREVSVENGTVTYNTGIRVEIPEGFLGFILPRSSIKNYDLTLANAPGLIDSGYRGDIKVVFKVTHVGNRLTNIYSVGERIAQLLIIPYPYISFEEVKELSFTNRGEGGFGSTNKA